MSDVPIVPGQLPIFPGDIPAFPVIDDAAYASAQAAANKITPETHGEDWERARSAAFREELLKHISSGQTLRDAFAIAAPVCPEEFRNWNPQLRGEGEAPLQAAWAYVYADAMLRARTRP